MEEKYMENNRISKIKLICEFIPVGKITERKGNSELFKGRREVNSGRRKPF